MGQAPATDANSVRTFPRNFPGRSGTEDDKVYLSSPETAVAAAIFGRITDPRKLGPYPKVVEPKQYIYNDAIIQKPMPLEDRKKVEILRGPNIAPFPAFDALPDSLEGQVLLKTEDNISTDSIMPAGNEVLPLRSNIPLISEHLFKRVDKTFYQRCKEAGGGVIVGGENYGQGSSREHAAIAPRYLGIRVKIAKSFARIHWNNLINYGILPLTFKDPEDYGRINQGDIISFPGIRRDLETGALETEAAMDGRKITLNISLTQRERACILEGGLLNAIRKRAVEPV